MNELINTKWLSKNLNDKDLVIFDCSWFLPSKKINPEKEYKKKHIKGAYFFNIEQISDRKNKLPHTIPSIKHFKDKVKKFNIHKKSKIVTYGSEDIMGPARVWWMFKFFGFNNIYVLNGGFGKWIKEKRSITNKKSITKKTTFEFAVDDSWCVNKDIILKNLKNKKQIVFDARNKNRFNGLEKEPRKGLFSGHIPNSKNIFWKELTNNSNEIINKKLIKEKFKRYNLENKDIILSCGSGISACVLSLSLMHALDIKGSVYDGSWAEWGSNTKLPKEK